MSDLPSPEELAASDKEVWMHALLVASQNATTDLTTVGILDHIRHLLASGVLKTEAEWRGSINVESAIEIGRGMISSARMRLAVDAALGIGDADVD